MSITEISIINDALTEIGAEPISSLDDSSKRAVICKRIYPIVRDYVLIAHPWRFAQTRSALSAIDEDVVFGYDYQFQLPSDCLRVNEIEDDVEHRIEGDRLLTNEDAVNIRYTKKLTNTALFTPEFAFACAYLLAAKVCYPITQSRELVSDLTTKYINIIRECRSIDAQAMGSPEEFEVDTFLNSRL